MEDWESKHKLLAVYLALFPVCRRNDVATSTSSKLYSDVTSQHSTSPVIFHYQCSQCFPVLGATLCSNIIKIITICIYCTLLLPAVQYSSNSLACHPQVVAGVWVEQDQIFFAVDPRTYCVLMCWVWVGIWLGIHWRGRLRRTRMSTRNLGYSSRILRCNQWGMDDSLSDLWIWCLGYVCKYTPGPPTYTEHHDLLW